LRRGINRESDSDIEIKIGNKKVYYGHSFILKRSKVLKDMIKNKEIIFDEKIDLEVFEEILNHLYTGVCYINEKNFEKLMKFSQEFNLVSLNNGFKKNFLKKKVKKKKIIKKKGKKKK
jgi:hypothetical protein